MEQNPVKDLYYVTVKDRGHECGGQSSSMGLGKGVLILTNNSSFLSNYHSYYLLLVSEQHPLRRVFFRTYCLSQKQANHILCDDMFFLVPTTSPMSKPTTSFVTICFFSRDFRSTQSLIIYVPTMYPIVYLAKVFCLNPVHKYISGVWAKCRTSYSSLAKKIIHSGNTRFAMYF